MVLYLGKVELMIINENNSTEPMEINAQPNSETPNVERMMYLFFILNTIVGLCFLYCVFMFFKTIIFNHDEVYNVLMVFGKTFATLGVYAGLQHFSRERQINVGDILFPLIGVIIMILTHLFC